MSKRARYTVQQVLDELFLDEDSDFDPEKDDLYTLQNRHSLVSTKNFSKLQEVVFEIHVF